MFEPCSQPGQPGRVHRGTARFDAETVTGWIAALAAPDRGAEDTERIEAIAALERLKSAAAAAQAVLTSDFAASQRAAQRAAGVPVEQIGRGAAAQVALARRDSPHRGSRHLGLARALVEEMPATMAALRAGQLSEWRATIITRETACLAREERSTADAELAARPGGLAALSDRQAEAEARKTAYRLDPHAYLARIKGAEAARRVTLRPAPDTMARLSGFLPVAQGVAAYAALGRAADTARAGGDSRSRGQIMADTMVERLTGQAAAEAVPIEVHVVMSDTALIDRNRFDEGMRTGSATDASRHSHVMDAAHGSETDEPAHLDGFGPIPAPAARDLIRRSEATVWLRRLFTRPGTGELIAMESTRRRFPKPLRRFLVLRDQFCRTPWCGAPIRHADHAVAVEAGGRTTAANGQGLCEACNLAKQAPGFTARPSPGGAGETVEVTTPTGHTYTSHAPPPPGQPAAQRAPRHPANRRDSLRRRLDQGGCVLEAHLRRRLDAA